MSCGTGRGHESVKRFLDRAMNEMTAGRIDPALIVDAD
jgi:hypothetical protein